MSGDLRTRIAALTPEQRALLAKRVGTAGQSPVETRIPRRPGSDAPPLSFAQQRLWFLDQLEPEGHAYNLVKALRLRGPLRPAALRQGLDDIVARHEALRTTFATVDGHPVQVIAPALTITLPLTDLEDLSADAREAEARRLLTESARRRFDLARGPLFRAELLRLGPTEHILLLAIHHIVHDGWSLVVLLRELAALYRHHTQGTVPALPPLPIQYADYAVWQRDHLRGEVLARELAYWRRQLEGAPGLLELPTDRPRRAERSYDGAKESVVLPASLVDRLQTLGRQENATLFMTLLATLQALLARYSGQDDIVVGSPIAGRSQAETEGLIGFFVNSLTLRTDLSGDPSFRELLRRVREVALEAYDHQQVPFEKLVEELQPARSMGHAPLFQVMLVHQNVPRKRFELTGLETSPVPLDSGAAKFDLTLYVREEQGGVRLVLEYSTDLFEAATAARLLEHYRVLLEGMLGDPDRQISRFTLLSEAERGRLLDDWCAATLDLEPSDAGHRLFEAQAARTPEAIAVAGGAAELSYAELNRRADALAHRLRAHGVGPEVPVAICVERSVEMLVGMLGILKAGGAYLPLDPAHPTDRLAFILQDAAAPVLVTQRRLLGRLPNHAATIVVLDEDTEPAGGSPPALEASLDSLAYVIYTSGSTGRPKGVQVSHRSLANFLASMQEAPGIGPADTLLAVTTLTFDIAGLELLLPLTMGARVTIATAEVAADGRLLAEELARCGATILQATPATWRLLVEAGWTGAPGLKALCGGEALPPALAERLSDLCGSLWNMYGPTETTIYSAGARVSAGGPVSLGGPIAGTRLYVLDRHGHLAPVGVSGELYIGGVGLARGYLRRPGLTAERFMPDPFSGAMGARMYRTGDLMRCRADGRLEFLGRRDHQVKIRGFRVETGEVEAVLGQHPGLQQAVVVAGRDSAGETCLVAYVVGAGGITPALGDLRAHLAGQLPGYMVPSAFVALDRLPLTPAGKLDRSALPSPSAAGLLPVDAFLAPGTPAEEAIAAIWAAALNVARVGVNDNFFELGGHSLLATRVIARIREAFHCELPLRAIFEEPTVAGLARIVGRDKAADEWENTEEALQELDQLSDEEAERLLADLRERA